MCTYEPYGREFGSSNTVHDYEEKYVWHTCESTKESVQYKQLTMQSEAVGWQDGQGTQLQHNTVTQQGMGGLRLLLGRGMKKASDTQDTCTVHACCNTMSTPVMYAFIDDLPRLNTIPVADLENLKGGFWLVEIINYNK